MSTIRISWPAAMTLGLLASPVLGQAPGAAAPPPAPPPSALVVPPPSIPNTVAATVNGQPIMEAAIQRALKTYRPEQHAEVRPKVVDYLRDKLLIDQYVAQFNIAVEAKEIDAKMKQVREEFEKRGMKLEKVLYETLLTEAELRQEIEGQMRWEKFLQSKATDAALRDLFAKNRETFDGTVVRARHILVTVPPNDPKAEAAARVKLLGLKKQMQDAVALGMSKLPASSDKLVQERERARLTDAAFVAIAGKESACPSKSQGGDLGFFPRSGSMVEPFARVAFTIPNYQISDIVATEFGLHLILVTDRKPGKQLKYEEVQEEVKHYFGDRMRDTLLPELRAKAKVVVNPPPKP